MTQSSREKLFYTSEEGALIRRELEEMMESTLFRTESKYTPSQDTNQLFVDRHMKYLGQHGNVQPKHYLSNLKLMTRISN